MRLMIRCPHCSSKTVAEDCQNVSRVANDIVYRCRNHLCGHVFRARLEAVRTLRPSLTPSPLVLLPVSPNVRHVTHRATPSATGQTEASAQDVRSARAPGDRSRYRYITIRCPHCQASARVIDSREMSRTLREVSYRCDHAPCRHDYVAQLEIVETLSLSSMPDADIRLPLSTHLLTAYGRWQQLHELFMGAPNAPASTP